MSKYYLKEIASKIGSGATPTGGKNAYKGGTYALIRSQNVLDMHFSREGLAYIDDDQAKKLDGVKVESGDVLFNITGDSICRCCNVPEDILPARVNQHVAIIRPTTVNSKYLMYYLQYLKPYLLSICGNGSSRNALTKDNLENLEIEISPFSNLIADVLSLFDKKIINNKIINSQLESISKTIYDYWFLQFEFPNEEGKPYKSSGGKMVWNNELKREIPEGWEVRPILDFCSWEGTSQPPKSTFAYEPKDGYVRFIQNRDYEDDTSHPTYIPLKENTPICDERDILMDKYGDAGRVRFGLNGAYNVALSKIVVMNKEFREYIRSFFESDSTYNYLHNSSMASTRASLNENNVSYLYLPVPPKHLINEYNKVANLRIETTLKTRKENKELASLRDFLLPMLMNGQVTFKEN